MNKEGIGHRPRAFDPNDRRTGVVKWFDEQKQYGFITLDDGDVFLHAKRVSPACPISKLTAGAKVSFCVTASVQGLQANDVRLVG